MPCNKTITMVETADLYIKNVFTHYGLPNTMISDRGLQFTSHVFKGITTSLQIKHKMSTAFHPQTNGQTERYNVELEAYLQIFCAYELNSWSKMLPTAQFMHNSCTHEALKESPFQLMYGTSPVALPLVSSKTDMPATDNHIKSLFHAREEALTAHDLAHIKMIFKFLDSNHTLSLTLNGLVLLVVLSIPYESRKLSPKREGPFLIKEVLGPVTYRLTLLKQWKVHNVFHAALLTPFKETTFHGTMETRLPPDLVDGQQEYKVEAILTHHCYRGKYQSLFKWKGYDSSENTWEPGQNFTNMEELLNTYKSRRKL